MTVANLSVPIVVSPFDSVELVDGEFGPGGVNSLERTAVGRRNLLGLIVVGLVSRRGSSFGQSLMFLLDSHVSAFSTAKSMRLERCWTFASQVFLTVRTLKTFSTTILLRPRVR